MLVFINWSINHTKDEYQVDTTMHIYTIVTIGYDMYCITLVNIVDFKQVPQG